MYYLIFMWDLLLVLCNSEGTIINPDEPSDSVKSRTWRYVTRCYSSTLKASYWRDCDLEFLPSSSWCLLKSISLRARIVRRSKRVGIRHQKLRKMRLIWRTWWRLKWRIWPSRYRRRQSFPYCLTGSIAWQAWQRKCSVGGLSRSPRRDK